MEKQWHVLYFLSKYTLKHLQLFIPSFPDNLHSLFAYFHGSLLSVFLQYPSILSGVFLKVFSPRFFLLKLFLILKNYIRYTNFVLFRYPSDINTYKIDTQFFWGSALLISPVLKEVCFLNFILNN